MDRKHNKSIVDTKIIADFFGMPRIIVNRHIVTGKRLDFVYSVLNNDNVSLKDKRNYLFKNTSLSLNMKINLWERFIGDFGYEYCKSGSYSLDFEIIQEGGTV